MSRKPAAEIEGEPKIHKAAARRSLIAILLLGLTVGAQLGSQNVANVGLVEISKALGMAGGVQIIASTIATVVVASTVITSGVIADHLGRRQVLVVGLGLAAVAPLLTAVSANPGFYIVMRGLTGIAMGILLGCTFAFIPVVAMPGRTAAAIGMYTASISAAAIVEGFIGSALISVNWRLSFVLAPIVALVALLLVPRLLPHVPRVPHENKDLFAHLLLIVGIATLLAGFLHTSAGLTNPVTMGLMLGGAGLLAVFAIWELRSPDPMYPIRIFAKPVFLAAITVGLAASFVNTGLNLQTENIWQYLLHLSTVEVALAQGPAVLATIGFAILVGRWLSAGRLTRSKTVAIGAGLMAVGSLVILYAGSTTDIWIYVVALVLLYAGFSGVNVIYGQMLLSQAPIEKFGPVTSTRSAMLQVGSSIGAAISLVTIDKLTVGGLTQTFTDHGASLSQISSGVDFVVGFTTTGDESSTQLALDAYTSAADSYHHAFAVFAGVCFALVAIAGVTALVLLRRADAKLA